MHFAGQKSTDKDKTEGEGMSKLVHDLEAAEDQKQIILWRTGEQGQLLTNQEKLTCMIRGSQSETDIEGKGSYFIFSLL